MASFDLRTEPWVPVLEPDGSVRELGLLNVFADAHHLRDLASGTPLEYVATVRFLVAVVHRALDGPRTIADGRSLYRSGRIPAEVLRYVESDAGVWDLFDQNRPWLQAPSAANDAPGDSPLSRLLPWQPSGNNPVLWEHTHDAALRAFTPAQAARALLVAHPYALGGGVAKPFNFTDGTVAGSLVCVAIGASLVETIALNTVRYGDDDPMPRGADDAPAWERAERTPTKDKTLVSGYVDFLTLTTRRVLLKRDADGLVRRCRYAQGLAPRDIGARDQFVPYRETKAGLVPMRPSPARALWRDLPAIAAGLADRRESTGVLAWAAELTEGAAVRLRAVGIVRSQAKIDTAVDGELRVPPPVVRSVEHRGALQDAVTTAEDSAKALTRALRTTAEHAGAGAGAGQVASQLLAATMFWARLERSYDALVETLSVLDASALDESEPERRWADQLRRETRRSYEDAVRLLGSSPRELMAAARGRNQLEGWIHRHLAQPIRAPALT